MKHLFTLLVSLSAIPAFSQTGTPIPAAQSPSGVKQVAPTPPPSAGQPANPGVQQLPSVPSTATQPNRPSLQTVAPTAPPAVNQVAPPVAPQAPAATGAPVGNAVAPANSGAPAVVLGQPGAQAPQVQQPQVPPAGQLPAQTGQLPTPAGQVPAQAGQVPTSAPTQNGNAAPGNFSKEQSDRMLLDTTRNCFVEIQRYCKAHEHNAIALRKCLYPHLSKMAGLCKRHVTDYSNSFLQRITGVIQKSCSQDVKLYCSHIVPGQNKMVPCLKGNPKTSATCKSELQKLGI